MGRNSDIAQNWRDHRDRRWKARRSYHDCPNCVYGGNARKVAPGTTCFDCGWETPEYLAKQRKAPRS